MTCGHSEKMQVGRHDHRSLLRPLGDHLEHQLAGSFGERQAAQLVDAHQNEPRPTAEHAAELVGAGGLGKFVDEAGRCGEPHPPPLTTAVSAFSASRRRSRKAGK